MIVQFLRRYFELGVSHIHKAESTIIPTFVFPSCCQRERRERKTERERDVIATTYTTTTLLSLSLSLSALRVSCIKIIHCVRVALHR